MRLLVIRVSDQESRVVQIRAVLSAMFLSRESAILLYIKMGLIENMMGAPDYGMSEHICMLEHHIVGLSENTVP